MSWHETTGVIRRVKFYVDDIDDDLVANGSHLWGKYIASVIGRERKAIHIEIAKRMGLIGMVDHKDTDYYNNSRLNLRVCTVFQSLGNRKIFSSNTSGFKGVSQRTNSNKCEVTIRSNYNRYYLCSCFSPIDAAESYDLAIILLREQPFDIEFNFPQNREKYLEELKINEIKTIYGLKNYLKKKI